jgi:hypothetical protein
MLNLKQSDCRFGGVAFAAGEDLSLKAGHLVKLNAGKDLVLPETDRDFAPYVVVQGADQGYLCGAVPVTSAMNIRVKLVGTCDAGALLVSNGDGRVKAFTSGSQARPVGTAEETGVDGQLVLVRPLAYGVAGPAGADGAPGADGQDGADGGVMYLNESSCGGLPVPVADTVGKVLVKDSGGSWWCAGQPVMMTERCALAVAYADGVFTCVDLGPASPVPSMCVTVPVAHIVGTVEPGCRIYYFANADNQCVLQVDTQSGSGGVYFHESFQCLGVGAGKATLAFVPPL